MLDSSTAFSVIRHLFQSGLTKKESKDPKGCYLVNCATELSAESLPAKSLLITNKDSMLTLLSDLVIQAQTEGDIDAKKDASGLALFLFSSIQGLRLTSLIESDPKKLSQLVDTILESL